MPVALPLPPHYVAILAPEVIMDLKTDRKIMNEKKKTHR
jgi:hypothetical protein